MPPAVDFIGKKNRQEELIYLDYFSCIGSARHPKSHDRYAR
jgi:hypothetical protein